MNFQTAALGMVSKFVTSIPGTYSLYTPFTLLVLPGSLRQCSVIMPLTLFCGSVVQEFLPARNWFSQPSSWGQQPARVSEGVTCICWIFKHSEKKGKNWPILLLTYSLTNQPSGDFIQQKYPQQLTVEKGPESGKGIVRGRRGLLPGTLETGWDTLGFLSPDGH